MTVDRRAVALVLALAVAAVVVAFWPRRPPSDEELIRALVAQCVEAANARDVSAISEHLAEDFRASGRGGKQEVKGVLAMHLLKGQPVYAFNPTLDVTVDGEKAKISGRFLFARAQAKSVDALPEGSVMSAYRIDADLEKREREWTFVAATHERL